MYLLWTSTACKLGTFSVANMKNTFEWIPRWSVMQHSYTTEQGKNDCTNGSKKNEWLGDRFLALLKIGRPEDFSPWKPKTNARKYWLWNLKRIINQIGRSFTMVFCSPPPTQANGCHVPLAEVHGDLEVLTAKCFDALTAVTSKCPEAFTASMCLANAPDLGRWTTPF